MKKRSLIKKVGLLATTAVLSAPVAVFADGPDTATMMSSALDTMKGDILGTIAIGVPVGFSIFGATIAIQKGMSFVKTLIHRA